MDTHGRVALSHIKEISADLCLVMCRLLLGWKTCTYTGKRSREALQMIMGEQAMPVEDLCRSGFCLLLDEEACGTDAEENSHKVGEALARIFARRPVSSLV